MGERTEDPVSWVLAAQEPAVRHLASRDLIGADSAPNPATITGGPWVSALLAGQQGDWGLQEYAAATGHAGAREAADRAIELFLQHRVFRRGGTGEPIEARWLSTPYPSYWHYDVLSALVVMTLAGRCTDPRASDALDLLEKKRRPDGKWNAQAQWWRAADSNTTPDVVDWGKAGEPNLMVTLNALRVLAAAGRVTLGH